MSTFERFTGFVVDGWPWVLLACVAVAVTCVAGRRSRWVVGVWLPSLVVTSGYTLWVIIGIADQASQPVRADFFEIWAWWQGLATLPLALTALFLLFVRPPSGAWRSGSAVVGMVLTVAIPLAMHFTLLATRTTVSFLVTNPEGAPLAGVGFRREFKPRPVAVTDARGRFKWPLERDGQMGGILSADGFLHLSLGVMTYGADSLFVSVVWFTPGATDIQGARPLGASAGSDGTVYASSPPPLVKLVMRPIP